MTLPHEDWDNKRVNGMAKVWNNPLALLNNTKASEDRHWRLINEIYKLASGSSILDVGCGMGHLYGLAMNEYKYLGIDSSEAMINKAKEFFPENKDKFEVGSVYDLSKYDCADTVVASGLILHLPDPKPVLNELWNKTLKCLVFSAWIGDTPLMWQGRQPIYKRILGIKPKGKYIIQRRDTIKGIYKILSDYVGVDKIFDEPFVNRYDGESNHLFKVTRKHD